MWSFSQANDSNPPKSLKGIQRITWSEQNTRGIERNLDFRPPFSDRALEYRTERVPIKAKESEQTEEET